VYDKEYTGEKMIKERILSVRTPTDLIARANHFAQGLDLSTSQVVRKLLREWVQEQEKQEAKEKKAQKE